MTEQKRLQFLPLKVLLPFLIVTEVLVWIGPINYNIPNPGILVFYLILVNVFLYLGYRSGVKKFRSSRYTLNLLFVYLICILGAFHAVADLIHMWSQHGLSINLQTVANAILNPGEAYHSESLNTNESSTTLLTLLSPFGAAVLPLGIFYWKKIPFFFKGLLVCTIFIKILAWLGIGTRKGLLDIILISFFVIIATNQKYIQNKQSFNRIKKIIILFAIAFIFYFVYSNLSRGGYSLNEIFTVGIDTEVRSFYSKYCPLWLLFTLLTITSYLCQGYYALGLGLHIGILPVAPMGMSWFTMMIARNFGYDPMPFTYMSQLIKYGVDPSNNWHTIYLWLANDFTFIGVPFVIFIIGKVLAVTWCDTIVGKNVFAPIVFSLMLIMVFYFFANNQVISFSFIPFVLFSIIYMFSRLK